MFTMWFIICSVGSNTFHLITLHFSVMQQHTTPQWLHYIYNYAITCVTKVQTNNFFLLFVHLCYNRLILQNSGAIYRFSEVDTCALGLFLLHKETKPQWHKLPPSQKYLHCTASTTLALCKRLHKKPYASQEPKIMLKLSANPSPGPRAWTSTGSKGSDEQSGL